MKILDNDHTFCFVKGYSFWIGIIGPFALAITTVIACYIYLAIRSHHKNIVDEDDTENLRKELVKNFFLFFNVGACWASLILVVATEKRVFDYWWGVLCLIIFC